MKQQHFLIHIVSLLLAVSLLCGLCSVTAFAEGEEDGEPAVAEPQEQEPVADDPADIPDDQPQDEPQQQDEPAVYEPETEAAQYEPIYEYLGGSEEDFSSDYEAPEYLDELPEAAAEEVVPATAVVIPSVEVSDASLFSGIVMWLCVALGIAVLVGVLVSRRTLRRGM